MKQQEQYVVMKWLKDSLEYNYDHTTNSLKIHQWLLIIFLFSVIELGGIPSYNVQFSFLSL